MRIKTSAEHQQHSPFLPLPPYRLPHLLSLSLFFLFFLVIDLFLFQFPSASIVFPFLFVNSVFLSVFFSPPPSSHLACMREDTERERERGGFLGFNWDVSNRFPIWKDPIRRGGAFPDPILDLKRSLRDCPAALLGFPLALAGDPAGFPLRFSGSFGLVRAGRCGCGNLDGISLGDDFGSFDSGDASSISRYFLVVLARRLRLSFFASVPFFIDYTFYGRGGFFLFFLLSFSLSLSLHFFFLSPSFSSFSPPLLWRKMSEKRNPFCFYSSIFLGIDVAKIEALEVLSAGWLDDALWKVLWFILDFFFFFFFLLGGFFLLAGWAGEGGGLFQRPGSRLL